MIKVLFFAAVKEQLDCEVLELDTSQLTSIADVKAVLASKGDDWKKVFSNGSLLAAVNQEMVSSEHPIANGDEVAFFPPVTGG
jgi:molybdopterin synthase sulfur carrier subunit